MEAGRGGGGARRRRGAAEAGRGGGGAEARRSLGRGCGAGGGCWRRRPFPSVPAHDPRSRSRSCSRHVRVISRVGPCSRSRAGSGARAPPPSRSSRVTGAGHGAAALPKSVQRSQYPNKPYTGYSTVQISAAHGRP